MNKEAKDIIQEILRNKEAFEFMQSMSGIAWEEPGPCDHAEAVTRLSSEKAREDVNFLKVEKGLRTLGLVLDMETEVGPHRSALP